MHAADATGLVVVAQLDPIAVLFTLPEDDLPRVSDAMSKGELVVDAYSRDGNKMLAQGKLAVIDNEINQATATVKLKAIFDNPKNVLWPNQFVKARLKLATEKTALVVPAAAVQHGPSGDFVYVVNPDSTAAVKKIGVESLQGEIAVISSGLNVGDQAVTDGQVQLRPGSRVAAKVMAAAPNASGSSARNEAKP